MLALTCAVTNKFNQTVRTFKKYTINQGDVIVELELNQRYLLELKEQIKELDDETDLSFIRYALNWSRTSIETDLYEQLSRAISDLIEARMFNGIQEEQYDQLYNDYMDLMAGYVYLKNQFMATITEIDDIRAIKVKTDGYKPRKPTDDDLDLILMRRSQLRDMVISEFYYNNRQEAL